MDLLRSTSKVSSKRPGPRRRRRYTADMPFAQQPVDFASLLKGIPAGAWVAISSTHDKVVAFGFEILKVKSDAERAGETRPLMVRVPLDASALFF